MIVPRFVQAYRGQSPKSPPVLARARMMRHTNLYGGVNMPDEGAISKVGATVNVVSELIKAAGDNPDARTAANNLGKSAETITTFINNALLPIAAINFSIKKAKEYFEGQFSSDMKSRVDRIPLDSVVEPKASIAGPALQGLAFSFEEAPLRELYLNLLATAMDGRQMDRSHPAFVEALKQLTATEADLIKNFCCNRNSTAIVQYQSKMIEGHSFNELQRHVMDWHRDGDGDGTRTRIEIENIQVYVDNWIRLGLVEVDYGQHLSAEGAYDFATARPEHARHVEKFAHLSDRKVDFQKGIIRCTDFGFKFGQAVGLNSVHEAVLSGEAV